MDRRERLGDLNEAILAALQGWQAQMWTALPARIISFDAAKMTVQAQPVLQIQVRDPKGNWNWVSMPPISDCPVMFPGGGGFTLTFPVAADDECLLVFANRCIDLWWQNGDGVHIQADYRMHDLSDGFAFVGVRSQPRALGNVQTNKVELRNDGRSMYVQIDSSGGIKLKATTLVTIDAPDVTLTGNLTAAGTITGTTDVVAGTKALKAHVHSGVQSGGSNTGGPV
jgi:hypothetical protein